MPAAAASVRHRLGGRGVDRVDDDRVDARGDEVLDLVELLGRRRSRRPRSAASTPFSVLAYRRCRCAARSGSCRRTGHRDADRLGHRRRRHQGREGNAQQVLFHLLLLHRSWRPAAPFDPEPLDSGKPSRRIVIYQLASVIPSPARLPGRQSPLSGGPALALLNRTKCHHISIEYLFHFRQSDQAETCVDGALMRASSSTMNLMLLATASPESQAHEPQRERLERERPGIAAGPQRTHLGMFPAGRRGRPARGGGSRMSATDTAASLTPEIWTSAGAARETTQSALARVMVERVVDQAENRRQHPPASNSRRPPRDLERNEHISKPRGSTRPMMPRDDRIGPERLQRHPQIALALAVGAARCRH